METVVLKNHHITSAIKRLFNKLTGKGCYCKPLKTIEESKTRVYILKDVCGYCKKNLLPKPGERLNITD